MLEAPNGGDVFVVLGDVLHGRLGTAGHASYVALEGQTPRMLSIFESPSDLGGRLAASGEAQQGLYRCLLRLQADETAKPEAAPWALVVGIEIDEQFEEEFNEWYDTEHLPLLASVAGVVRARRFVLCPEKTPSRSGAPPRYLAIFDLEEPHIPRGERWHAHVSTPWCDRIFRFRRLLFRTVYARVPAGQQSAERSFAR
jgi:hypothetical protein